MRKGKREWWSSFVGIAPLLGEEPIRAERERVLPVRRSSARLTGRLPRVAVASAGAVAAVRSVLLGGARLARTAGPLLLRLLLLASEPSEPATGRGLA